MVSFSEIRGVEFGVGAQLTNVSMMSFGYFSEFSLLREIFQVRCTLRLRRALGSVVTVLAAGDDGITTSLMRRLCQYRHAEMRCVQFDVIAAASFCIRTPPSASTAAGWRAPAGQHVIFRHSDEHRDG